MRSRFAATGAGTGMPSAGPTSSGDDRSIAAIPSAPSATPAARTSADGGVPPRSESRAARPTAERDPRLPKPGTVLTRAFKNREIKVEVLDAGFRYDGDVWRSLSAIARKVSGTSWNGFLFFNLLTRAKKASATPTETK